METSSSSTSQKDLRTNTNKQHNSKFIPFLLINPPLTLSPRTFQAETDLPAGVLSLCSAFTMHSCILSNQSNEQTNNSRARHQPFVSIFLFVLDAWCVPNKNNVFMVRIWFQKTRGHRLFALQATLKSEAWIGKERVDGIFSFIVSNIHRVETRSRIRAARPAACFSGSERTVRFGKTPIDLANRRGWRHRRRKQPPPSARCDVPSFWRERRAAAAERDATLFAAISVALASARLIGRSDRNDFSFPWTGFGAVDFSTNILSPMITQHFSRNVCARVFFTVEPAIRFACYHYFLSRAYFVASMINC